MITSDEIILTCSTIGLVISLYFTLVYYHIIRPDAMFIPAVCRMDEGTCQRIMQTREASILGVPNFVLALVYYTAVIVCVFMPSKGLTYAITAGGFATVVLGIYLTYTLLARLRVNCVLCYASHVNNTLLFILLIAKHFR